MVFGRFRRSPVVGRLSCYGKLPLDREFLRFHLDSDEGRWLVPWIDGAHHVMAASEASDRADREVHLRVVLSRAGGRTAVAALIRPSTDGGGRSYPICVFATQDARDLRDCWYLAPVWASPLWEVIEERILDHTLADRDALAAALDSAPCPFEAIDAAAQRFDAAARASVTDPWRALTGVSEARGRELAAALVQLGKVQRTARTREDGVAVSVPLATAEALGSALDGTMQVAAWVRLLSIVANVRSPWPAIIEVWRQGAGKPESVCIFGREPTVEDLAYLLAGVGDVPIDDVTEPWDSEPSEGWAQNALAGLLDADARCVADLWRQAEG